MFELRESDVNGTGVFATQDIPSGTELGIWCCKDGSKGVRYLYNEGMEAYWFETPILGRYCNHSDSPNTSLIVNEDSLILVSSEILSGQEILANYTWVTEHIGYVL